MHRAWAFRRAWRVRLGLAAGLALALLPLAWWVHPAWALLSGLALLYPSRWEEGRALAELDRRYGLAYRSALEAPPNHPWRSQLQAEAEASLRAARLPPWPWALLVVYLLSFGLVWLPPGGGPQGAHPVVAQPEAPAQATPPFSAPDEAPPTAEGSSGKGQEPAEGESEAEASPAQGQQPAQARPTEQAAEPTTGPNPPSGGTGAESVPEQGQATPTPGQLQPQPSPGASQGGQPTREAPGQPQPAPGHQGQPVPHPSPGAAQSQAEQGSSQGSLPGQRPAGGSPGDTSRPTGGPQGQASPDLAPANLPSPAGEAPLRRGEAGQGRPQLLPSPWAAGQPPKNVQRQAEKYLQSEPLPPEVRRILRRYFELPP